MQKKLMHITFIWIFIWGFLLIYPSYADTISYDQKNLLATLLNQHGTQAKTGVDFYNAGIACHDHKLDSIAHLDKKDLYVIFYNDSLGNCVFSLIFIGSPPDQTPLGESCIISDSEFAKIFTPWNFDAVKAADRSTTPNPVLNKFLHSLRECLKTTPIANILTDMQSSTQSNQGQN